MGAHPNVGYTKFPNQSDSVGKDVRVCFGYDIDHWKNGTIVRDDTESPYIMLIHYVRSTECQYAFQKVR